MGSSADPAGAILAKAAWRLIPIMCLMYVVSFLDRSNISFAALTMNSDLGFSPEVYGRGAGIFFLGYFLFEVPSNLALEKVGARAWMCRIMVTWACSPWPAPLCRGRHPFSSCASRWARRRPDFIRA